MLDRGNPLRHAVVGLWVMVAAGPVCALEWSASQVLNANATTDSGNDYDPHLATDGAGHWVCVWHSNDSLGGTIGTDFDILMARSEDNGATWIGPVPLDPLAGVDSEGDFSPAVATDRNGHWIVMWYTREPRDGSGLDLDLLFVTSDDNGATWTTPAFLNTDATTDADWASDYPDTLATDGHGNWMAYWDRGGYESGGGPYHDFDIYVAVSTNGASWSPPSVVNSDAATDSGYDRWGDLVTDGNGMWLLAWYSENMLGTNGIDDTDIHFSYSTDFGDTWSAVAALNTTAGTDTYRDTDPKLATDGAGRWVAVWDFKYAKDVSDPGDYDVYVATSTNGITWSPPAILNSNGTGVGYDWDPVIATDALGHWVVVWESRDSLGNPPLWADRDIVWSQSTDNGATWSPPAAVNDFAALDISNDDYTPSLAYAGNGYWLTAWFSTYNLGGTIGTDRDILFATSCLPVQGDHECDGDVDLYDFSAFQVCFGATAPLPPECEVFDADNDEAVNLDDFAAFSATIGGPHG